MITVHIHANDHEEAHVASARFALPAVLLSEAEQAVKEQLRITVRWAEEREMLIGHAKAYLTWGGEEARMLSTTGAAVEVKGSGLPEGRFDAEVGVTVIVFGAELEDAEDRLEGFAAAVVGQFGDWCAYEHSCEHHHDHGHDHGHHHHGHDGAEEHHHHHGEEPC